MSAFKIWLIIKDISNPISGCTCLGNQQQRNNPINGISWKQLPPVALLPQWYTLWEAPPSKCKWIRLWDRSNSMRSWMVRGNQRNSMYSSHGDICCIALLFCFPNMAWKSSNVNSHNETVNIHNEPLNIYNKPLFMFGMNPLCVWKNSSLIYHLSIRVTPFHPRFPGKNR